MTQQHLDPGTLVFDAEGKWVGIVSLHNTPGSALVVQKGRWFPKNLYLPVQAIDYVDDGGVSLRLSKDDLKNPCYARPLDEDDTAPTNVAAMDRDGEPYGSGSVHGHALRAHGSAEGGDSHD